MASLILRDVSPACRQSAAPRSWVPSRDEITYIDEAQEHVERQDNQNADGPRHGDGKDQQQLGISRDPHHTQPRDGADDEAQDHRQGARSGRPRHLHDGGCRGKVWITTYDCPFICVAILETAQADNLVELMNQTTNEARRYRP